jgi:lipid-A-disaccharide synthase
MHREGKDFHSDIKKVAIIAGEASGDLHGSNLVKAIQNIDPLTQFYGIGGEKLKEAGVKIIADSSDMAVVGLTEVLSKLGFILSVRRKFKQSLYDENPDLLILIDYPDFNLPLAKVAKKFGIKVFYYISPQVWAWRKKRIYAIARYVDRMAVILPFETSIYDEVNLDVHFVGHPLLDVVKRKLSRDDALREFGLKASGTIIGILPGSRENEVAKLLPEMLKAAHILKEKISPVQFVLPLADTLKQEFILNILNQYSVDVTVVENNVYDVIGLSDIVMVASGTATLETALLEIPMVIVYKVSPLSYFMGRIIINVDHIGMVNIIAGKKIVPEFIQNDATSDNIANEIYDILLNIPRMDTIKGDLSQIREKLGSPGAADRAAELAYELIEKESGVRKQKSE